MGESSKLVLHLVGNAHIDPVWLWRVATGVDESLATCRTACNLLDEYPELHITRGESWVYEQVERFDPALFERIKAQVAAGRWHLVNGWVVQADCNFPTPESFRRQGELGQAAFRGWFGCGTRVGYNVDSFGHTAMLPDFLRHAGMDYYVFQRPEEHEKKMPSDVFVWRAPTGAEVIAARLWRGYAAWDVPGLKDKLEGYVKRADRTLGHAMVFYGVGDHGGGPTREMVDWLLAHRDDYPGVEFRFSHPLAFFEAIKDKRADLPVVEGELQFHAVGCYTAVRELKEDMRRAEELATQADIALADADPSDRPENADARRDRAWRRLLFNQFHDILPGSSIESACREARAELGGVQTEFRELADHVIRRQALHREPCVHQRMVLRNLSDRPYDGWVEFEPNANGTPRDQIRLTGEDSNEISRQDIQGEAAITGYWRTLFRVRMAAGERQVVQLRRGEAPTALGDRAWTHFAKISNNLGQRIHVDGGGVPVFADEITPVEPLKHWLGAGGLRFVVREDTTDTWSHGVPALDGRVVGVFESEQPWTMRERGPWRASMANEFHWRNSRLVCRASLYGDDPWFRLTINAYWNDPHCVLKLCVASPSPWTSRVDAMPGAFGTRPLEGQECPMNGWTLLSGGGKSLGVVSRDVFGLSATPEELGLTLLRSPVYAHHEPTSMMGHHPWPVSGMGFHRYEIALRGTETLETSELEAEAHRQTRPVWMNEITLGMPPR